MRISLLTKFFLSFLVTGAVLVAVLISLVQVYGVKNFSDYVARKDYRELDSLIPVLEAAYREHQSWNFLKQNHYQWQRLLRKAGLIPEGMLPPPPPGFPMESRTEGPPPAGPPPHDRNAPPPPGPASIPNELGPRVSLLNKEKRIVMGRRPPDTRYLRPLMDQKTVVGYVGFARLANLSHPLDLAYLKQQKKIFFMAGLLFLASSVLVSLVLAVHLLSPIKKLSRATRKLGQRKFDTRLHLKTGDELGQLARDFNHMAVTLGEYETRQSQWLSDISHELRTPLSILKGELEAVQDGIRPLQKGTIDTLHIEVSHLIRLVSDLHDLSMAEARMMELNRTQVDVSGLLCQILDRFRAQFHRKGFELDRAITPGITLLGDRDRLTQLFSNLLKNGLAYTDPPGRIRICCAVSENAVRINVENSGPGVEESILPRLFDRLFRADAARSGSETGRKAGSGLGLAICKEIVLAHKGRIRALRSSLGGINIDMTLPTNPQGGKP